MKRLGLLFAVLCLSGACADATAVTRDDAGIQEGAPNAAPSSVPVPPPTADEIVNAPDNPFPCENPTAGAHLGEFDCDNGLTVRPRPFTCPAAPIEECTIDADCGGGFCECYGHANGCSGEWEGDCGSDLDCAPGFHCDSVPTGRSDWVEWHRRCQQPSDECVDAADCLGREPVGEEYACQGDEAGRFCCSRESGCPTDP